MPPKRAARAATAAGKQTSVRSTRSRAVKEPDTVVDASEVSSVPTRRTRTRKSDVEAEKSTPRAQKTDTPEPRTAQRPLTRGRPPRTVKKVAPSQANKKTLDALKKRMEDERRANLEGVVPKPDAPESRSQQAERAVREAENNDGDAALVPAAPLAAPQSPSPARLNAPGTAVKAPATVTRPQSALKMQSTPGAETSVLALQNFRRRPRQPSLLQMVQNPDLDLGLGLGNDTTDFTLGASSDEEEFAPHDESTPLQIAKAKAQEAQDEEFAPHDEGTPLQPARPKTISPEQQVEREQTPPAAQQPQDDEDDEDDLYTATPRRPRQSRKRKSDALEDTQVQVIRSSPSLPHSPHQTSSSPEREIYDPIPATLGSSSEAPATTESQQRKLLSDTYADPVSSPPASPLSPSSPRLPREPREAAAAVSPTTTRKSARSGTAAKQKPLTTATLRALLPKRRRRGVVEKGDFEVPSSSSQSQAASSSFEEEKRKKARSKARAASKKGALSPIISRKKTAAPVTSAKESAKTYARKPGGGDKENHPVVLSSGSSSLSELSSEAEHNDETVDTSIDTIGPTAEKVVRQGSRDSGVVAAGGKNNGSDELKKAREKFADIDTWEMEFESASLGAGGDSSPWR